MNRFLHVGFMFAGRPKVRDLEPAFVPLGDWIRYSTHCWILWTDKPVFEVYRHLAARLDQKDQILIAAIDPNDAIGFLSPWMWTWMQSKNPLSGVVFGDDLRQAVVNDLNPMLPKGG